MREGGEELVLQAARLFRLAVQLRILDSEPDPVGDDLEELGVAAIELPALARPDVEHADHLALEEDRHAEERADALLDQDWMEHVRGIHVLDVLDEDGSLLRRDATGEAAAHPRADAALLPEPLDRARHQLVALEQQDGRGVGTQERAHADEEFVEEMVEREVCERRVDDGFELADGLGVRAGARAGCLGLGGAGPRVRPAELHVAVLAPFFL